jgi:hypothetical protein
MKHRDHAFTWALNHPLNLFSLRFHQALTLKTPAQAYALAA